MLFNKIVVAYDGSNTAEKALEYAIQLCMENRLALLRVVNVLNIPPLFFGADVMSPSTEILTDNLYEYAMKNVEKAQQLVSCLEHAEVILKEGNPAEVILDDAEQFQCDLLIIGSRGLGGVKEFFLGSVSHNVVQHARFPVLVVK